MEPEKRRAGRPKGSGRGLVTVSLRIDPETYRALDAWAETQGVRRAEAARALLREALEGEGAALAAKDLHSAGYRAGVRQAISDVRAALGELFKDV